MKQKTKKQLSTFKKTKHNSNSKTQQITLEGKILKQQIYYVLGFVSADVIRIENNVWFRKLDNEQLKSVVRY